MSFTHTNDLGKYGVTPLIVASLASNGSHTTLASALAAAVTGDTVFLRDSVTENVTLPAGVNISCWDGGTANTPTITGKITMTAAGTSTISGIRLVTNSDFIIAVTGSAVSILNVDNCYLNCTNNTGISYTTAGLSSINFTNCKGDLGTTGIAYFVSTSNGDISFTRCNLINTGGSSTASTLTVNKASFKYTVFASNVSASSTASISCEYSDINWFADSSRNNTVGLAVAGSGAIYCTNCIVSGGSSAAITVGTGCTANVFDSFVDSSNSTSVISGAGTLFYGGLIFNSIPGVGSAITVTTQNLKAEGPSRSIGSLNDGGTNTLTLTNTSNTASSAVKHQLTVAGGTAADPQTTYTITGATNFSVGLDNSASDAFVIAASTALGTTNVMSVATTGEINFPLQSAFLAMSAGSTNVTGDGTNIATIAFATEIFDQNSDFASDTYTAPVTGRYHLDTCITWDQTSAATQWYIGFTTSNRSYQTQLKASATAAGNAEGNVLSVLADMDAADTAVVYGGVAGLTKTVDILGAPQSYFSGYLAC